MRFLLDVNVLMALGFPAHAFHTKAHSWFHRETDRQWATCPLTQAGFLRLGSRELGGTVYAVRQALAGLERDCQSFNHEYWPVDVDLRDLTDSLRTRLIGRDQITDMQLLVLAHQHKGQLVTFDTGIKELASGTKYAGSVLVL